VFTHRGTRFLFTIKFQSDITCARQQWDSPQAAVVRPRAELELLPPPPHAVPSYAVVTVFFI